MFKIRDSVRVLPPFFDSFPGVYAVTEVVHSDDGTTAYVLGECGGFDAVYLEAAP